MAARSRLISGFAVIEEKREWRVLHKQETGKLEGFLKTQHLRGSSFSSPGPRNGGFSPSPARREGCIRTQVAAASSWCHVTACDLKEKPDFPTSLFKACTASNSVSKDAGGKPWDWSRRLLRNFSFSENAGVCAHPPELSETSSHHTGTEAATLSRQAPQSRTGLAHACHLRATVQTLKQI